MESNTVMMLRLALFAALPVVFAILLFSVLMWGASKILKFRDRSFVTALKVSAGSFAAGIILAVVALIPYILHLMEVLTLFLLPLALLGTLIAYFLLTKRMYGED